MKKYLGILLSVAMILALLAGCGGKAPGSDAGGKTDTGGTGGAAVETMGETDVDLTAFKSLYTEDTSKLTGLPGAEIKLTTGTSTAFVGAYIQGLIVMKDLLEDYSNGTMTMDIHGDSALGGERDMIESVSLGSQEMTIVSTGPTGNYVPDFYSLDLPYLFHDAQEAYTVLDSEVGRGILDQFLDQGVYAVNFWENGFRNTSNNKREIIHPEDLKGLKLRTMENNIHMATYNNWGAYPTPMAFGEVFTACQQGTIDGQENPLQIIASSRIHEVQPFLSLTQVFYSPSVLMINKDLYDSFTDFQKACFDKAAEEAQTWERNFAQATVPTDRALIESDGTKVSDVDIAEWAASEGVAKVYADAVSLGANQDLIDAAYAVLGR